MSSPATIAVGDRKLYQMPQWPPSHRNRAFLVEKSVSRWGFLDKIAAICICLQSLTSTDHLRASNIVETSPEKLPLSTMVKAVANLLQATLFLAKTKQTKTLTQTKR